MTDKPAILGGRPLFESSPRLARPWVPALSELAPRIEATLRNGMLTNADNVRAFEAAAARVLEVDHAVAVSSGTDGLILAIRCLGIEGRALVPAFTFCATAHAADWNGLPITFVEPDPETFCIDPDDLVSRLDGGAGLIVGTHVFGCPCEVVRLEAVSRSAGLPLLLDAAQAFGSRTAGRAVGAFGDAEVFSLTPTKPVVAGEGGLVTTRDAGLARELRAARNYGDPGDYDCTRVGLNARMSEWSAILALSTLELLPAQIERRARIVDAYRSGLGSVPGIGFQRIPADSVSAQTDFTVMIDPETFGLDRDGLAAALDAERIPVRKYFSPPLHRMKCYRDGDRQPLPVAERLSARALSLPIHALLEVETVAAIVEAIGRVQRFAGPVRAGLESGR